MAPRSDRQILKDRLDAAESFVESAQEKMRDAYTLTVEAHPDVAKLCTQLHDLLEVWCKALAVLRGRV